jgi:hypothetical protein
MHGLNYIIYANEQAARRAKARRIKKSYAEAPETIKRITRSAIRNRG